MKKKKTFTLVAVIIAVLILGIGYAAISNITLTLNGTANVKANADFSVVYDQTHSVVVSNTGTGTQINWSDTATSDMKDIVAGAYTSDTVATMTVYLDKNHDTATAIYKVDNKSEELGAKLATPSIGTVEGSDGTTPVRNFSDYIEVQSADYYTDADCTTALGDGVLAPKTGSAYLKVVVHLKKNPVTDITGATFTITTVASPVELS